MRLKEIVSFGRYAPTTLLLAAALNAAWFISLAVVAPIGLIIALLVAIHVHFLVVWGYFVWQFLRPRRRLLSSVSLLRPVYLFVVTILAMAALHATLIHADASSYNSSVTGADAFGKWGMGIFVAIETMATLGSGAIAAATGLSLAAVAYNCLTAIAYNLFALGLVMSVFADTIISRNAVPKG